MSYLLYCILNSDRRDPPRLLRFHGYPRASIMVRAAGLGAVASRTSFSDRAPDVARLLVYAKIIEWYNEPRSVIPMRYGCTFPKLDGVARLLEERQDDYLRLLAELEGRVEMSTHVTLDDPGLASGRVEGARLSAGLPVGPGTAYLTERRRQYVVNAQSEKLCEEIHSRLCAAARGTFVRSVREHTVREGRTVLSAHFLVEREEIARFTEAVRQPNVNVKGSQLTTGPWPPYNFVRQPLAAPPGRLAGKRSINV